MPKRKNPPDATRADVKRGDDAVRADVDAMFRRLRRLYLRPLEARVKKLEDEKASSGQ